jgi:hypothetical protein
MKTKLALISTCLFVLNGISQVSVPTNGPPGVATDYVGWNATRLFPVTVAHKGNFPVNFETNGIQRMTILNTSGFVGIGNSGSALNPLWQLDVNDNANLNIAYLTNPGFGYRINGNKILSNPGTKNIFVGNGAGTGWSSLSPINYTQAKAVFF